MTRLPRCPFRALATGLDALTLVTAMTPARAADEAAPMRLYHAPVSVAQPGPYVELALPGDIWRRSTRPGLQDLRLLDADGARVPFALLPRLRRRHRRNSAAPPGTTRCRRCRPVARMAPVCSASASTATGSASPAPAAHRPARQRRPRRPAT